MFIYEDQHVGWKGAVTEVACGPFWLNLQIAQEIVMDHNRAMSTDPGDGIGALLCRVAAAADDVVAYVLTKDDRLELADDEWPAAEDVLRRLKATLLELKGKGADGA